MKTRSILIILLFALTPLGIVDAGHTADEVDHCDEAPDGDPLHAALCGFVAGQEWSVISDDHGFTDDDYDDDGRSDLYRVNERETGLDFFIQTDFFITPTNDHYGPAGLPQDFVEGDFFDVWVSGVMLYDPSGILGPTNVGDLRLTNHYGVDRDTLDGNPLSGYIGLYTPDGLDGYGLCEICVQPETNRISSGAGPATHDDLNGAEGTVGLLKVGTAMGMFTLDFDAIDPSDSRELEVSGGAVEDSVLEAHQLDEAGDPVIVEGDRVYIDDTATVALLGLGGLARGDLNFVDGKPFDPSLMHIKWPGDRGQPTDVGGLYTKYSNLDDDPNTDLEEVMCVGQPTNPTNPNAHCNDWDGDGIPNSEDDNPRAPDLSIEISWGANPAATGEEAPYLPQIQYDCTGELTDLILQRSYDGGAWVDVYGRGNAGPTACGSDGLALGNDKKLLNALDQNRDVELRLLGINVVDIEFASENTLDMTLLANAAPTGTYTVTCVAPAGQSCTDGDHTARSLRYTHTFTTQSNGGPTEASQTLLVTLFDGFDRNGNTAGIAAPTLTHQGGGVYAYTENNGNFGYAEGAIRNTRLTVVDTGGASIATDPTSAIEVPHRKETAPVLLHDAPSAEDGSSDVAESGAGGLEIRVAVEDVDNHQIDAIDVTLFWRQGEDPEAEYAGVPMTALACNLATTNPGYLQEDLLNCPTALNPLGSGVRSTTPVGFVATIAPENSEEAGDVEYYFHAENPDAEENAWDEQESILDADDASSDIEPFTTGASGGPALPGGQGVPDPLDYIIGDCNLLSDVLAAAGSQSADDLCARDFDPENYGVKLPGDETDPHDTDGDGDVENSNQQIDIVEKYVFYYNPDEDVADDDDDLSGTDGFTLHVWENRGVQDPRKKDYSIRVSDVVGTLDTELVVVVDRTASDPEDFMVHCIIANDGRNAYYTHPGDWSHDTGCGERHSFSEEQLNPVGESLGRTAWFGFYGACSPTPVNTGDPLEDQEDCPAAFQFVDADRDNIPDAIIFGTPSMACIVDEDCDPDEHEYTAIPIGAVPEPDPDELCEDDTEPFPDCVVGDDPAEPVIDLLCGAGVPLPQCEAGDPVAAVIAALCAAGAPLPECEEPCEEPCDPCEEGDPTCDPPCDPEDPEGCVPPPPGGDPVEACTDDDPATPCTIHDAMGLVIPPCSETSGDFYVCSDPDETTIGNGMSGGLWPGLEIMLGPLGRFWI